MTSQTPTVICVKVRGKPGDEKRVGSYPDLRSWMEDPTNLYIGRAGIVFVTDKDGSKRRWPPRSSVWANPFKVTPKGHTRAESIARYEEHLRASPELMERLPSLSGKTLGCWCKPQPCHGDVLVKLFNEKVLGQSPSAAQVVPRCLLRIGGKRKVHAKMQGYKNINVTSGSGNILTSPTTGEKVEAKSLSPLKGDLGPVTVEGETWQNFENWWQSSKVFPHLGHADKEGKMTEKYRKWRARWQKNEKGTRHLPGTRVEQHDPDGKVVMKMNRGKECRALRTEPPAFAFHRGEKLDYIASRKNYVQEYCRAIKKMPAIKILFEMLKAGEAIMIIDGDGPPIDLYPEGIPMDGKMVNDMYENPKYPFGHGYVVALVLDWMCKNR